MTTTEITVNYIIALAMMSIDEFGGIPLRSIPPNLISTPKQIEQNRKKQLGRQSGHCTELKN